MRFASTMQQNATAPEDPPQTPLEEIYLPYLILRGPIRNTLEIAITLQ